MRLFTKYVLLICSIHFISCYPNNRDFRPNGDVVEINTVNDNTYTGELLTVDDGSMLLLIESGEISSRKEKYQVPKIYRFPKDKIQYLEVENYINKGWQGSILTYEVLPVVLLIIAASAANADSPEVVAVLLLPALINYGIFAAATEDPPGVVAPFETDKFIALRKYSRFPQGLTDRQLNALLSIHNQNTILLAE